MTTSCCWMIRTPVEATVIVMFLVDMILFSDLEIELFIEINNNVLECYNTFTCW